jgi:hypothetical protein
MVVGPWDSNARQGLAKAALARCSQGSLVREGRGFDRCHRGDGYFSSAYGDCSVRSSVSDGSRTLFNRTGCGGFSRVGPTQR